MRASPGPSVQVRFRDGRGEDEYILEVAIIWGVPLLDPARWEAIVSTLWWTRVIALSLRLALVRVAHVDENDEDEEIDDNAREREEKRMKRVE